MADTNQPKRNRVHLHACAERVQSSGRRGNRIELIDADMRSIDWSALSLVESPRHGS